MYQPLILQRLSKIVLAFHFGCKATCLPPSKQMHLKRWWSTKPEEKKIMGNFTAPTLSGDLVHKNLIEPSTVWTRILPCKITGWNLKITCCEKGKSNRNQTFIFGVPAVSSSGVCVCVPFPRSLTHSPLQKWWDWKIKITFPFLGRFRPIFRGVCCLC